MGKIIALLILCCVAVAATLGKANANGFTTGNWFGKRFPGKEKVTELQLYVQDILTGPTPTNIAVATANSASPTFFGVVAVIDDPIRIGPNSNAKIVGRAQGLFAFASLEEISIHMTFDLVLTRGKYNGSTLSVMGRNPYPHQHRELSVVGGSGAFRLARGFVGITTASFDNTTGNAFFEYNITVLHY